MFRIISDLLRPAAQKAGDKQDSKRKKDADTARASERTTRSELAALFRFELKGRKPD